MTTSTRPQSKSMTHIAANRSQPRSTIAVDVQPSRREYRERDFGIGYGRSSGYASDRRYASDWNGPIHFRCG